MSNAFLSLLFSVIDNVFSFLVRPEDWVLFRQRYRNASTCVSSIEGPKWYQLGSGTLPGDQIAATMFRDVFQKPLVMQIACRATPWDVQFPYGRNAPHEAVREPVPLDHALRKTTPSLIQMLYQTHHKTTPISVSQNDTEFGLNSTPNSM